MCITNVLFRLFPQLLSPLIDEGHVLEVKGTVSGAPPSSNSEDDASLPQPVEVTIVTKGGQVEKLRELTARQNKRKAKDKKLEEEKQKRSRYVQPSLLNGLGKEQVWPSSSSFFPSTKNKVAKVHAIVYLALFPIFAFFFNHILS